MGDLLMNNLMKRSSKLNNKKGFTLVELIVVIVIIGILAAVLAPKLGGFTDKAREAGVLASANQIATAAEALYAENGKAPTSDEIKVLAGVDGTITDIDSVTTNKVIEFVYTTTVKGVEFTATRGVDGKIAVVKK